MEASRQRALRARLDDLRRGGRDQVEEVPPTREEAAAYRSWVGCALQAAREESPMPEGAPPGFALELLPSVPEVWVLAERAEARRGSGCVVLRVGEANRVVFEAPHTFFDRGTLPIALEAFESQCARGLIINTVHRSRLDVAHADLSFFLAAHQALLETGPAMPVVQIHGFVEDAASGATVIVSAAGSIAEVPAARLRAVVGEGVRVFPDEIRRLGGTTNVQARASRRAGAPFLHVEIARSLRDRLVADVALARTFAAALMPREAATRAGP
jgi:hypothetical protein